MANRRFAVIGLGRFGSTLARGLAASGQEVIAIDSGQELIEGLQDVVDQAVRLIEPLVLVMIAGAIGFVALGLLYPIFTMAQTMK